jgi:hypothetical protein
MSYLSHFLEAAKRACDWGVGEADSYNAEDWQFIVDTQKENGFHQVMKLHRTKFIPMIVSQLFEQEGGHEYFASHCHTASATIAQMLAINFERMTGHPFPATWLTFGAVYYKDLNVYNVTVDSMREIAERGFELSKLDLHCWVTLSDMFVLDISILASLKQKGIIDDHLTDKTAYIIQDGNLTKKLRYEPILVSDRFIHHIDRISVIPPVLPPF